MTDQPTTEPAPDRDNYLSALAALLGALSKDRAREIHKKRFLSRHSVDPNTIRALVQLDCLEQDRLNPGSYRAMDNLFHVTPEAVMERLALIDSVSEAQPQPAKIATRITYEKAAKEVKPKKTPPLAFFTPEKAEQAPPPVELEATVQIPEAEELATVAEEVIERIAVTLDSQITEELAEAPPLLKAPDDVAGIYFYNSEMHCVERIDGNTVNLGDVCSPAFKAFAKACFPERWTEIQKWLGKAGPPTGDAVEPLASQRRQDLREATAVERAAESLAANLTEHLPEPEATQRKEELLSEMEAIGTGPIADVTFVDHLYNLNRLFQKASVAAADLADLLCDIDNVNQQLTGKL